MRPARALLPVYRLLPPPVRRPAALRHLAAPLILLGGWLAIAATAHDEVYRLGPWHLHAGEAGNLLLLLLLGWGLARLLLLYVYVQRGRPAGRVTAAVLTALSCWLAVAVAPEAVTLRRTVALGEARAGMPPISADERWRLASPAEWLIPAADPLPVPARRPPLYYLLRTEPASAPAGAALMSCPDYQEGRHGLFTVEREIRLQPEDLPGMHWPYGQLAGLCRAGVVLSGDAASPDLPPRIRERLLRLAGPTTTDYTGHELSAAQGHPGIEPPAAESVTARARYLLFLELGARAASVAPAGMALASWRDFFYAANQCDPAYARYLLDGGVQYPDAALGYLARELQGVYVRDARARRPAGFPYGLAQGRDARECAEIMHALAGQSSGATLADPVVAAALAAAAPLQGPAEQAGQR